MIRAAHSVRVFLLVFLTLGMFCSQAQTGFSSEEELKKKALELFDKQDYIAAAPLYSQLLSLYPQSTEYNFRYGASLIYSDADKIKPLKYLLYSRKDAALYPEIEFFLGRTFHLNYRFADAESSYNKFLQTAPAKLKARYPCVRELEMAASGQALTRSFSELKVEDKKLVSRANFFRSYELGDFGGKIIVKPEEFNLPADRKREDQSLIFLPDDAREVYFSSYGENGKNGKDIYVVRKLPSGGWGKPEPLGSPVNSPFDEDFPFLHPNGNILYFCSNGHNSMGGYDVFKSEYNAGTGTWTTPVNMEFPLNSPGDEMLFITNAEEGLACFASSREAFGDKIHVYRIKNEIRSGENVLLAGNFVKPSENSGPLSAEITVIDNSTNLKAGVFRPNQESGDYLLNLPGSGSYKFLVAVDGFPTQTGIVEIPAMDRSRPLRQQMELITANGTTRLVIRNLFDETVTEAQLAAAMEEYLKRTSKLEVNYLQADREAELALASNQEDPGSKTENQISANTEGSNQTALQNQNNSGEQTGGFSNQELVNMAYEGVEELREESKELKEEADYSYQFAGNKTSEARSLKAQALQAENEAHSATDPAEKEQKNREAEQLKQQSEKAAREAVVAYNMALQIEDQAKQKENEAEENHRYAEELSAAINSKNEKEAIRLLEEQKERLEVTTDSIEGHAGILSVLAVKQQEKEKEAASYRQKEKDQKDEILSITDEMDRLRTEAAQTKDKDLQEQLLLQVTDLETEKQVLERQSESLGITAARLEKEAADLSQDLTLVKKIAESKGENSVAALSESDKSSLKAEVEILGNEVALAGTNQRTTHSANTTTSGNQGEEVDISSTTNNTNSSNLEISNEAENNSLTAGNSTNENQGQENSLTAGNSNSEISSDTTEQNLLAENYSNPENSASIEVQRKQEADILLKDPAAIFKEDGTIRDYKPAYQAKLQDAGEDEKADILKAWQSSANEELKHLSEQENKAEHAERIEELESEVKLIDFRLSSGQIAGTGDNTQNEENTNTSGRSQENTTALNEETSSSTIDGSIKPENSSGISDTQNAGSSNETLTNSVSGENTAGQTDNSVLETELSTDNAISGSAREQNLIAEGLAQETQQLTGEAEALRSQARESSNAAEREQLFEDAAAIDRQIWEKRAERELALSRANQGEFLTRETHLNKAVAGSPATEQQKDVAELLREESQRYFSEARKQSASASGAESQMDRIAMLEKAREYEMLALNKQNEALKIYSGKEFIEMSSSDNQNLAGNDSRHVGNTTGSGVITSENNEANSTSAQSGNENNTSEGSSALTVTEVSGQGTGTSENESVSENFAIAQKNEIARQRDQQYFTADSLEQVVLTYEAKEDSLETALEGRMAKKKKDQLTEELERVREEKATLQTESAEAREKGNELQENLLAQNNPDNAGNTVTANNNQSGVSSTSDTNNSENNTVDNSEFNKEISAEYLTLRQQAAGYLNESLRDSSDAASSRLLAAEYDAELRELENSGTSQDDEEFVRLVELKEVSINASDSLNREAARKRTLFIQSDSQAERLLAGLPAAEQESILAMSEGRNTGPENRNSGNNNSGNESEGNNSETSTENNSVANNSENTTNSTVAEINPGNESQSENSETTTESNSVANNSESTSNSTVAGNTGNETVNSPGINETGSGNIENSTGNNSANSENTQNLNNNSTSGAGISEAGSNESGSASDLYPDLKSSPVLSREYFSQSSAPLYNESNPIPMDLPMPEGLVFKVQVGAFRNPIPQNLFRNFTPVSGERTGQGFTRYTVGYFRQLETARTAKDVIRGNGYPDAFIVAYLNGKRIPYQEALALSGQGGTTNPGNSSVNSNTPVNQANENNSTSTASANSSLNTTQGSINNTASPANSASGSPVIPEGSKLNNMKGVLFTVQVGVYSRPVSAGDLNNLAELFVEETANGYYRYTNGIFKDQGTAAAASSRIRDGGIRDAFVIAYVDGKKVSVAEAERLLASGSAQPADKPLAAGIQETGTSNQETSNSENSTETTNASNSENSGNPEPVNGSGTSQSNPGINTSENNQSEETVIEGVAPVDPGVATNNSSLTGNERSVSTEELGDGLVYVVQIGAFRDQVPNDIAAKFLRISHKGIRHFRNDNGFTLYSAGKFSGYSEASLLRDELSGKFELPDAFVVAYFNGDKIEIEKAREMESGGQGN